MNITKYNSSVLSAIPGLNRSASTATISSSPNNSNIVTSSVPSGMPTPFSPDITPTLDPAQVWSRYGINTDISQYGPDFHAEELQKAYGGGGGGNGGNGGGGGGGGGTTEQSWLNKYWWVLLLGAIPLIYIMFQGKPSEISSGSFTSRIPKKKSKS